MPEEFNMEKQYNPQAIEDKTYRHWEESGAFTAHRVEGKKPFTIVMPPPNITGQLHMGHAHGLHPAGCTDPLSPHEGRSYPVAARHRSCFHRHRGQGGGNSWPRKA